MTIPQISFVIPVYNTEKYICECLESILVQAIKNFEVFIVDDGSTDSSGEICDEYQERFQVSGIKCHVVHQANGGVSVARNKALDMASGEYIWFVDADDYIEKDSLTILSKALTQECDTIFFGLKRMRDGQCYEEERCIKTDGKNALLKVNRFYQNGMILFSNQIIQKYSLRFSQGMKMGEDLEFQYKYLLHCNKPIVLSDILYYFRARHESASHSIDSHRNNIAGNIRILDNILDYAKPLSDRGTDWLGPRMAERVKNLMQSAALTPQTNTAEINRLVRKYIKEFRGLGFKGFEDKSLKLASIDIRIYYCIYKFILRQKGIKI